MLDITPNADEGLAYPNLRPTPQLLQLLMRAALADDEKGGPWLSVMYTHTPKGERIYTHHIHMHPLDWHSSRRLVLLSGDEILSYAKLQRLSLVDHTGAQLRRLGTYACELHDAPGWDRHYVTWVQQWNASALDRQEAWDLARGDARALRWSEAERWLAGPSRA